MRTGYLPEWHDFKYIAQAPWPHLNHQVQMDWVDAVCTLESWLEQYIGPHHSRWAYHNLGWDLKPNHCCLAFRWDRDRTLFILRWANEI
jgi:hypothetical protein